MNNTELRNQLKQGKIENQYLLIGNEPLLIEYALSDIKNMLKVDQSFDLDTFVVSEAQIEEIMSRYYLTPFGSKQRLVVVKNLEELDQRALTNFAKTINSTASQNCLVMTYVVKKDEKKPENLHKKLAGLFTKIRRVVCQYDKKTLHQKIMKTIRERNLNLSSSMIQYLEDEFAHDITGLKNEFAKIENYLYEAKTLTTESMGDLAKGLCDFDNYRVVNTFLRGEKDTLTLFEELLPYMRSHAKMVDALTRRLVYYSQRRGNVFANYNVAIKPILDEISKIDRKVKRSSQFVNVMLELLFLKNAHLFRKGAIYGRKMA
jgi:DNA polymerase III delta subunit